MVASDPSFPSTGGELRLPRVIGHRGAAAYAPENTLAGFRLAARLGVSWVEFDVQLTADDVPVVIHDARLDRTTDGIGRVRRTPLARLKRLDAGRWLAPGFAGERVPTLEEALAETAALGLGVNIEIKPGRGSEQRTAHRALAVVAATWPADRPRPLISSFSRRVLAEVQALAPNWPRGLLVGALPRDWRAAAAAFGCVSIHCDQRRLTAPQIAQMRAAGYRVLAYTVNAPDRAAELWEGGVDSIFSDVPDVFDASAS